MLSSRLVSTAVEQDNSEWRIERELPRFSLGSDCPLSDTAQERTASGRKQEYTSYLRKAFDFKSDVEQDWLALH